MADSKAHIKLGGKISGRSQYRSCEGWIDVVSHSPADRPGDGTQHWGRREDMSGGYNVSISGQDPVIPLIAQAGSSGAPIGTAMLDMQSESRLLRATMTDVLIENVRSGAAFQFTLVYKSMQFAESITPTDKK